MEQDNNGFNAENYLNEVANDYIDRMQDCFGEIEDYIMEVEPKTKTSEQIRDDIYQMLKKYGFKP